MEDTREIIRNIKKELRLYMNGVTSMQQRRLGMSYNIIFGVSFPHLKEIAGKFGQDADVAKTLWKENIRESKLLAILLLPAECYADVAEQWIGECRYRENADHLAHRILSKLPDAVEKALVWANSGKEMYSYCGYLTLSHMFRVGAALTPEQEQVLFRSVATHLADNAAKENATMALNAITLYCDEDEERKVRFDAFMGS
ncbi:MAG: DNA alkylation repair protein [Bacteroidaceae bacterium]|nr:DNA alkylation repair protein [Bacteroidaceae bacterium]